MQTRAQIRAGLSANPRRCNRVSWGYISRMKRHAHRIVIVAIAASCAGCGLFKTQSPITGRNVSADQLAAESRAADNTDKQTETAIKRELETAQRAAESARAKSKRAFDSIAAQIEGEAQTKLRNAAAELEQQQADADAAFAAIVTASTARLNDLDAARIDRHTAVESALADIRARQEWVSAIVGTAESVGGLFGPVGGLASALIGAGGLVFGLRGKRDAASTMAAATRVIDAIDVLKQSNPTVAAAFKDNGKLLSEWMGTNGVALVNRAQQS